MEEEEVVNVEDKILVPKKRAALKIDQVTPSHCRANDFLRTNRIVNDVIGMRAR